MPHTSVNLQFAKRLAHFPYPVLLISMTNHYHTKIHDSICGNVLGVCIRLASDQPQAEDTVNGVTYCNGFPNVFFKYPKDHLRFGYSVGRETLEIKYDISVLERLREALPFPEKPVFEYPLGSRENSIINELQNLVKHSCDYGVADRIDILAFELLEFFLLNGERGADSAHTIAERQIMKAASYFQLHFKEKLNWEELLPHYGMSRSTFLRYWGRFFSQTPDQYRLELRLKEACRLLEEEPNLSIAEISEQLNFCETNYFCSVFRRRYGITPLQMRKQFLEGGRG